MGLLDAFWSWIYVYLRPLVKGFLRRTTGLCELQRICYGIEEGAQRTKAVEYSINMSRSKVLKLINEKLKLIASEQRLVREWVTIEQAIEATMMEKKINPKFHVDFSVCYRMCLIHIYGYQQLMAEVSALRAIAYDALNKSHSDMLRRLWQELNGDNPLNSLKSKQWSEIGFQGDDPSTDFRGMGLLGLHNLLFFAVNYNAFAKHILQHSMHPVHGYPFAIVGINLTHLTYSLLSNGCLKTHFYNAHFRVFNLDDFNKVYCSLFVMFDKFWLESKPESVMEFRGIRQRFEETLLEKLESDPKLVLKWDPQVETL